MYVLSLLDGRNAFCTFGRKKGSPCWRSKCNVVTKAAIFPFQPFFISAIFSISAIFLSKSFFFFLCVTRINKKMSESLIPNTVQLGPRERKDTIWGIAYGIGILSHVIIGIMIITKGTSFDQYFEDVNKCYDEKFDFGTRKLEEDSAWKALNVWGLMGSEAGIYFYFYFYFISIRNKSHWCFHRCL